MNDREEYYQHYKFLLESGVQILPNQVNQNLKERRAGGVVNPDLDVRAVEQAYHDCGIVYLDGLLRPGIAEELRKFVLFTNVRHDRYTQNGYASINFEPGDFWIGLLDQLAEELPRTFPGIFANHAFRRGWSFICENACGGVPLHADPAKVNVNFWVTPDECQEEWALGRQNGLIVWDKPPPAEWTYADYNEHGRSYFSIRKFLAEAGAMPHRIPYACNRVAIFNSKLFHEGEAVAFKPGFGNRRINYTMLYGDYL